jgi:molybdopterin biosynthesis enzyme
VSSTLVPVTALLAEWRRHAVPVPFRKVPLAEGVGQVLAADLVAPAPVPAHPIALIAGCAVRSRDLVGVSPYAPLLVAAAPMRVGAGEALPPPCDAVIPEDAVQAVPGGFEISATAAPGENVRRIGEDAAEGAVLRPAGRVLRATDAAAAIAAGLREVPLRGASLLAVADAGASLWLEPLLASLTGWRWRVASRPEGSSADLILVVGDAPASLAATAQGVALKGAETARAGLRDGVPFLAAPARIDAVFALLRAVVEPFGAALNGQERPAPGWRGALTRKVSSPVGLTEIVLVRRVGQDWEPLAGGALSLAAIAQAEAWFAVPPESEGAAGGTIVEAFTL